MQKYEYDPTAGEVLYDSGKYLVVKLPEPLLVNADVHTHLWNYALVNKGTGLREAHADALPNAIALCFQLSGMLEKAEEEIAKEANAKAREKARENRAARSTH